MAMTRREILAAASGLFVASTADAISKTTHADAPTSGDRKVLTTESNAKPHAFNGIYRGEYLNQIAFPLGGLGAGMFCLEGTGALTKFSLRNRPDLGNEPHAFSAVCIKGPRKIARVLEGPVPLWKLRPFLPGVEGVYPGGCWGLPRFRNATFESRFPFATVRLNDPEVLPGRCR